MKRYTPILILFILIAAVFSAAGLSYGQSLRENEYYQKARELLEMAEAAHARGEYDKAYQLAEESKQNTQKAADLYAALLLKYRANTLLQAAGNRINSLKTLGVENEYIPTLRLAEEDYGIAKTSFNKADYERSIVYSNRVLDALEGVEGKKAKPVAVEEPEAEAEEPMVRVVEGDKPVPTYEAEEEGEPEEEEVYYEEEEEILPKYYRVRLIPERRDCFWRIAEYEFVYGDPFKWRILYDANKQVLVDPENPDLIHPGQLFEIPSIEGETREGEWVPED